jgi:hypothetical protein
MFHGAYHRVAVIAKPPAAKLATDDPQVGIAAGQFCRTALTDTFARFRFSRHGTIDAVNWIDSNALAQATTILLSWSQTPKSSTTHLTRQ